jgi:hypothetical protein
LSACFGRLRLFGNFAKGKKNQTAALPTKPAGRSVGKGGIDKLGKADTGLLKLLPDDRLKARAYWKGEASTDPRIETLFAGDAVVSAVGR